MWLPAADCRCLVTLIVWKTFSHSTTHSQSAFPPFARSCAEAQECHNYNNPQTNPTHNRSVDFYGWIHVTWNVINKQTTEWKWLNTLCMVHAPASTHTHTHSTRLTSQAWYSSVFTIGAVMTCERQQVPLCGGCVWARRKHTHTHTETMHSAIQPQNYAERKTRQIIFHFLFGRIVVPRAHCSIFHSRFFSTHNPPPPFTLFRSLPLFSRIVESDCNAPTK